MNCMKCGREVEGNQVFCPECLEEMKAYPVRPGTAVHLPEHNKMQTGKKPQSALRFSLSPEEQARKLRSSNRRLSVLVVLLLLVTTLLTAMVVMTLREHGVQNILGKNYSVVTPTGAAATETVQPG